MGESLLARCGDFVGCLWTQTDERFLARDVSVLLQFPQVEIQTAIDGIEPLFQGGEIKRALDLQRSHDAQPNGPVNGGVQSVEINGIHGGIRFSGFAKPG